IGFGLIYAPAIISVGYYFEKKRSFAMGIAVSASGLGTVIFPLIMHRVIALFLWGDYKGALLIESAIIFVCVIFGLLMLPLPQEPSEKRRAQRRLRSEAKRQAARAAQSVGNSDEQARQLLTETERFGRKSDNAPIQEANMALPVSDNVDPHEQTCLSDNQGRKSPSPQDVPSSLSDGSNTKSKSTSKSLLNLSSPCPPSVVTIRKDAMYQGSLNNIPLYNDDTDEYHRQVITTSDAEKQPVLTAGEIDSKTIPNKSNEKATSFINQLANEVDLKLLGDTAFALFTISNFLTSLGFNVPYNFAHDLAKDSRVKESQREYVIMSIGLSNAVGRILIGYLGDCKLV
ncbi:unnamed protein product, partial [Didymodactylos carnosus]